VNAAGAISKALKQVTSSIAQRRRIESYCTPFSVFEPINLLLAEFFVDRVSISAGRVRHSDADATLKGDTL
jgi:hypothetical protein